MNPGEKTYLESHALRALISRTRWASRANACVQPGSCRAANADGAAGWDGRIANERARGRAAWPLAQVARRALSDGRGGQGYSTLAPPVHHHITHESQLSALRGV